MTNVTCQQRGLSGVVDTPPGPTFVTVETSARLKMHPLWETRDVVLEVLPLLPKADQARIARVNTALWEMAIPWIWRDVPNIRYIFQLLPFDLWSETIDPLVSFLNALSIEFWLEEPTSDSTLFSALETISQHKTLSIEDMGFKFVRNVGASSGVIAQAIASQTSLRRLELNGYTDIAHLARSATELPLLEELEVHGMFADVPEINYNKLSFRSLRTFIAVGRPEMIHSLLRCIRSDRLERVALTFSSWRSDLQIHPELMAELERFRPHLAHLQLTVDMKLSWGALEPILALAELQAFHLETYDRRMAKSHPTSA
ncbi:hypothetical protein FRC00_004910 [Tulasnella sp. 408]|nr:hypothetical protein FRC00_004910 [Tulasnella sp. 408]